MSEKEKKFQYKLWLSAVLGSLIVFYSIKFVCENVNYSLLLILLIVGFVLNSIITTIKSKTNKEGFRQ